MQTTQLLSALLPALVLGCAVGCALDNANETSHIPLVEFCGGDARLELDGVSASVSSTTRVADGSAEILAGSQSLFASIYQQAATLDHPIEGPNAIDFSDLPQSWQGSLSLLADEAESLSIDVHSPAWELQGRVTVTPSEAGLLTSDFCVSAASAGESSPALRFYIP